MTSIAYPTMRLLTESSVQAVALKADREKLQAKIKELEEASGSAPSDGPADAKKQEDFEKLKKMVNCCNTKVEIEFLLSTSGDCTESGSREVAGQDQRS